MVYNEYVGFSKFPPKAHFSYYNETSDMDNFEILNELLKNWLISVEEKIVVEVTKRVLEIVDDSCNRDKQYSAKEICEISKISISTLNRWIKRDLGHTNTGRRTKRFFTVNDIESYKKKYKNRR